MARKGFDLATVVAVKDVEVAKAVLAKMKDEQFHHRIMLEQLLEADGEGAPVTCKELAANLESQKADLMDEAHLRIWDKYSDACHMRYFINRFRGAVVATLNGEAVAQTATKIKKAAPAPVEEPADATPVEEVVA